MRSRRARDAMVVLIPLAMTAFWLMSQLGARRAARLNWRQFLEGPIWDAISYLPSGLAARAIAGAARGDYAPALASLLALGLICAATLYLAGWLVNLVYTGEVISGPARRRAGSRNTAATAPAERFPRLRPHPRYWGAEPSLRPVARR